MFVAYVRYFREGSVFSELMRSRGFAGGGEEVSLMSCELLFC